MGLPQHTHEMTWRCVGRAAAWPVTEIPDSRFIVYAFKRRFMSVWASLNRGFRGLCVGLPQHTHEMTWRCVAFEWFDTLFFCKIVARWVYINTRMRWHDDAWPVTEIPDSRFIVYAFKRRFMSVWASLNRGFPGLCVAIVGFDALFFCKILARWVYLNTRMRWHDDALR
jgi:hypothetical protein